MNDQLTNVPRPFLKNEGHHAHLNDLLTRINTPDEAIQLSDKDKMTLSHGLHLLESYLQQRMDFATD